ncbi:MAG: hypothetical protein DWQ08_06165 [Proteobacteria bacterium]|nr:MAG: hypothetical protein DWQ08_06165 [Pseudomonadota bacterium]
MNRENALAATWASAYCVCLVLAMGLFDRLGVEPFYSVPLVVVVLPFVVALALMPFRSPRQRAGS